MIFSAKAYKSIVWLFRLIFLLAGLFIMGWGIFLKISHNLVLNWRAESKHSMVSSLLPEDRVRLTREAGGNKRYQVLAEPIYLDFKAPRSFDEVSLEVEYDNAGVPSFSVGPQIGPDNQFDLKLVQNLELESIFSSSAWAVSEFRNLKFLSKLSAPSVDIEDFFQDLPDRTASVNFDLMPYYKLPGYEPDLKTRVFTNSIRGNHTIAAYIKNEPLDFRFVFQDINRQAGADPIKITISGFDGMGVPRVVKTLELPDDGLITAADPATQPRAQHLYHIDLPEGVYKISIQASDDIFIKHIRTTQSKFVFLNNLYLTDNAEYKDKITDIQTGPSTVFSSVERLTLYTSHYRGLQTIRISDRDFPLDETHKNFQENIDFNNDGKSNYSIYIPKNDIKLTGRGAFALEPDLFFNPLLDTVDLSTANYIVAQYDFGQVAKQASHQTRLINLDLSRAYRKDGKYRIMFSVPGVTLDSNFRLYSVRAVFSGDPIGQIDDMKSL